MLTDMPAVAFRVDRQSQSEICSAGCGKTALSVDDHRWRRGLATVPLCWWMAG